MLAYGFLRHAWHPWCSLIDSPHPSPTLVLREHGVSRRALHLSQLALQHEQQVELLLLDEPGARGEHGPLLRALVGRAGRVLLRDRRRR